MTRSEKCQIAYKNEETGAELVNIFKRKNINVISWDKLMDDEFIILAYDLALTDGEISKMFGISRYTVSRRRNSLSIPRGFDRHTSWIDGARSEIINIDNIIKAISTT